MNMNMNTSNKILKSVDKKVTSNNISNYTRISYDKNKIKILSNSNKNYENYENYENEKIIFSMINRWQNYRNDINYLLKEESPYYNEENLWDIYNMDDTDNEIDYETDYDSDDYYNEEFIIDNDSYY